MIRYGQTVNKIKEKILTTLSSVKKFRIFHFKNRPKVSLLSLVTIQIFVCTYLWGILGMTFKRMSTPLGTGDITGTYSFQEILWNRGRFTDTVGFPTGISISDLANYEVVQSLLTGLVQLFTENIFLSVNLGIYFSHLICANIVYFVARNYGVREGYAALAAVASSTLPWIPGRIEHPGLWYLSICLAPLLLVRNESRKPRYWFSFFLGCLVGASGGYVVAFAFVIVVGIFVSKLKDLFTNLSIFREFLLFAVGVILVSGSSLFYFGFSTNSALLDRTLQDSVHYGGYLLLGFIPLASTVFPNFIQLKLTQILEQLPQTNEATWSSNFGSVFLVFVVIILGIYSLSRVAIESRFGKDFLHPGEKVLTGTILVLMFFCVKGGLGPLLTATLFPPIRAWNRLMIVIQICFIVLGFLVIQKFQTRLRKILILILIPLLALQAGANSSLVPLSRDSYVDDLHRMTSDLRSLGKSGCGVLQLPELKSDGSGAPNNLKTYDHYLAAVIGRDFKWSFGQRAEDFRIVLDLSMPEEEILRLIVPQYCAIEIDKNWKDSNLWISKLDLLNFTRIHNSRNFTVFSVS